MLSRIARMIATITLVIIALNLILSVTLSPIGIFILGVIAVYNVAK